MVIKMDVMKHVSMSPSNGNKIRSSVTHAEGDFVWSMKKATCM